MISPTEIARRGRGCGWGWGWAAFAKSLAVHFALAGAGGASSGPAAAAAKCAPVLTLAALVLLRARAAHHPLQKRYARLVGLGLVVSALGDALLVWAALLVWGMAAFAAAHALYIAAFGWAPRRPLLALAMYSATAVFLTLLDPPGPMQLLVPLYGLILATMAWRAAARWGARKGQWEGGAGGLGAAAGAVGALFFLVSDALLGHSLFGRAPLPYNQVLVMSTYYLAQLGIALSALDQPPPTAPSPPASAFPLPVAPKLSS